MKKNYLYLAAATLLLAGCAQDSFVDDNLQETTVPQEIKMSAGNRGISVGGRGIGSVGTGTDENEWNGETIHIYAFNKNLKNFGTESEQNVYLNGAKATVAAGGGVQFVNENNASITEYYPLQGAFRFVGYHTDGASGTAVPTQTDIKIPVTIDGTQDIMIAKADLSKDDKMKLYNAMVDKVAFNGAEQTTTLVDDNYDPIESDYKTTIENEYEKAYSSYTARRSVQPNLVFTHELVRLNFYVKAGDDKTYTWTEPVTDTDGNQVAPAKERGVYINNISVDSHCEGEIVIEKDGKISFNDVSTEETELNLRSKTVDDNGKTVMGPSLDVVGNSKTDYDAQNATKVGDGILVMLPTKTPAGQTANKYYTATIETIQYYDQDGTQIAADKQTREYVDVKIQKPQIEENGTMVVKEFEAGKSYDITITVYSNQSINVTATLTGWVKGGEIEINPEDEYFNSSNSGSSNND